MLRVRHIVASAAAAEQPSSQRKRRTEHAAARTQRAPSLKTTTVPFNLPLHPSRRQLAAALKKKTRNGAKRQSTGDAAIVGAPAAVNPLIVFFSISSDVNGDLETRSPLTSVFDIAASAWVLHNEPEQWQSSFVQAGRFFWGGVQEDDLLEFNLATSQLHNWLCWASAQAPAGNPSDTVLLAYEGLAFDWPQLADTAGSFPDVEAAKSLLTWLSKDCVSFGSARNLLTAGASWDGHFGGRWRLRDVFEERCPGVKLSPKKSGALLNVTAMDAVFASVCAEQDMSPEAIMKVIRDRCGRYRWDQAS